MPIPLTHNATNATMEQDYLTISDIFATAWSALDWSNFEAGDTVAVFGTGPVGLLRAYSAILRGASRVYVVDHVPDRLARAESIGAIPIEFVTSDPVEQILAHEPSGVMRTLDCVGMEALNSTLQVDSTIILRNMIAIAHQGGGIGQVGIFSAQPDSAGAPLGSSFSPDVTFPIAIFSSRT